MKQYFQTLRKSITPLLFRCLLFVTQLFACNEIDSAHDASTDITIADAALSISTIVMFVIIVYCTLTIKSEKNQFRNKQIHD